MEGSMIFIYMAKLIITVMSTSTHLNHACLMLLELGIVFGTTTLQALIK